VLEEGSGDSWFQDDIILWLTVVGVLTGIAFIWRQLVYRQPIVSLAPFRDKNFSLGIVMTFVTGVSLFGGTFLLPVFLGQVRGFSSAEVGTTMLVSGLTMFFCAPVVGRLIRVIDARVAMVGGFALAAWAIQLGSKVTDQWGFQEFLALQIFRGMGTMMAMIAAQQMSVSTLPVHMMKDASGLINLIRNVAGAIGLAMLTTILSHQNAVHYADLATAVSTANPTSQGMLAGLTEMMREGGMADPEGGARKAFSFMLHKQAAVLSFGDAFAFLALGCWFAAFLGFFAPKGRLGGMGGKPAGAH